MNAVRMFIRDNALCIMLDETVFLWNLLIFDKLDHDYWRGPVEVPENWMEVV